MTLVRSLLCILSFYAQGANDSPGLARLKAFVEALNSQKQSNVETFIKSSFSPNSGGGRPIAIRAQRLFGLASLGTPFTIGKVLKDEPTVVIAEIKNAQGDDWEMKMNFEVTEPHGATSVYMGGPGSQTSPPPKKYTEWKNPIDLLNQIKTDTKVPAIGIAFALGSSREFAVVGERDINKPDKVKLEDRWLIGSVTKSMTSMMIARLVDKGVMRWDTTIRQALPKIPMRKEYEAVTLLQLLQHRAGIQQDRLVTTGFLGRAAGDSKDLVEIREHYTQFTLSRDPLSKPGERMAYSNAGYSIAAHMAEVLANKPYEQLMQELVFNPLGMSSARFGVPGTPGNPGADGQINGHALEGEAVVTHIMADPNLNAIQAAAGSGVSISLEDLLKFAQYHLAGLQGYVTLMSPKNFKVLHEPAESGPGVYKYACGWVVNDTLTKQPFHGHNGSDGTFWAEVAIWPTQNFAAVSISNAANKLLQSPPLQAILTVHNRYCK